MLGVPLRVGLSATSPHFAPLRSGLSASIPHANRMLNRVEVKLHPVVNSSIN
jgi:hypothetical protein